MGDETEEEWLSGEGAPPLVAHQVISEAARKFEKMCHGEDSGGRPVHRARSWQKFAGLEKEKKATTWHKTSVDRVLAPLTIDPSAGELTEKIKAACKELRISMGMDVKVIEKAGNSGRRDAKSEPLRNKNCGRVACMCCSLGNEGGCETNSVGYRIYWLENKLSMKARGQEMYSREGWSTLRLEK